MPEKELPDWAVKAGTKAPVLRAPPPANTAPEPAEVTRSSAATEPSFAFPTEPELNVAEAAAVAIATATSPPVAVSTEPAPAPPPVAPADLGMVWALVVLTLVGPAMLSTQLPFGRIIAVAITVLGIGGGVACLGAEGRARLVAALAAALHLGALSVVLLLPTWLNLDSWRRPAKPDGPLGPVAVESRSGVPKPIGSNGWLDAAQASWQFRNVRVSLRGAVVGPVELHGTGGTKRTTKENYLYLVVQVTNVGLDHDVQLPGWMSGAAEGVGVTDANDQPLAPASFGPDGPKPVTSSAQRIAPGHSAEAHFVFTAPSKSAWVQVRLPAASFGAPDDIRFRAAPNDGSARGSGK